MTLSEIYRKKGVAAMGIRAFIMNEVERQGFQRHSNDWAFRVGAMMAAWNHAMTFDLLSLSPRIVEIWGMMVEPELNRFGFRNCGVMVGGRRCPDWQEVPKLMVEWCRTWGGIGPVPAVADEAYYQFELIHPFADGNGRTGKIIHNWLLERLNDPVLVKDFFGGGVP